MRSAANERKSLALIAAGRVVQTLLALVSVKVFTAILTPSEVGNLYLLNAVLGFFGFSLVNPVGQFINRNLHRWQEEGCLLDRLFSYNIYLTALSLLSVAVIYLMHFGFSVGAGIGFSTMALFVMISLYCSTWNTTVIPALNLLQHRGSFVVLTVLTLACGLGFSLLFCEYGGRSAVSWLYGQSAAQLLMAVAGFVILKKVSGCRFSRAGLSVVCGGGAGVLLAFAVPLGITNIFMWSQNQSYRLIVENRLGLEALGFISLGLSIAANIANAGESILQQLHLPAFYRGIGSGDRNERVAACNRYAFLTIPAYLSLTLFTTFLAPFILTILTNDKFSNAYPFVIFGAWIEFFRMITNVLANVAHSEMRTTKLVRPYLVGGVVTLALVWAATSDGLPRYIVPAALVLSGALTMLLMYLDMKKIMGIRVAIRMNLKAALMSIPLSAAIPMAWVTGGLVVSVVAVGIAGGYFLYVQYRLADGAVG